MKRKKFLSSLLMIAIMMCLLPIKIFGSQGNEVELSITPSTSEAHPGNIITCTVNMKPVKAIKGLKFKLNLPEGLIFKEGALAENLKQTLGATFCSFNPDSKIMAFSNVSGDPYTNLDSETPLMTFTCEVDENVTGQKTISPEILNPKDVYTTNDQGQNINLDVTLSGATINITIPATNITVSPTESTLDLLSGYTTELTASIEPSNSTDIITWRSSDETIATVTPEEDNKKAIVTALNLGAATIIVSATNGPSTDEMPIAECNVTIICSHGYNYEYANYSTTQHKKTCGICHTEEYENHTPGEPVIENIVQGTCETDEHYDEVVYCTKCNYKISEKHLAGVAPGHSFSNVEYIWSDDYSTCTATRICQRNNEHKLTQTVSTECDTTATCKDPGVIFYRATFTKEGLAGTIQSDHIDNCDPLGHNWDNENLDIIYPTDTEDGREILKCTVCGETEEIFLPALGKGLADKFTTNVNMDGQNIKVILQDPWDILSDDICLKATLVESGSTRWNELIRNLDDTHRIENIAFFEITLYQNNDEPASMPLARKVRVLIQIPEGWDKGDMQVALVSPDTDIEFEENVVTIDGINYIAFWTDHFSPYSTIDTLTDEEAELLAAQPEQNLESSKGLKTKTGENLNDIYFAELLLNAAILSIYLFLKKRKEA